MIDVTFVEPPPGTLSFQTKQSCDNQTWISKCTIHTLKRNYQLPTELCSTQIRKLFSSYIVLLYFASHERRKRHHYSIFFITWDSQNENLWKAKNE